MNALNFCAIAAALVPFVSGGPNVNYSNTSYVAPPISPAVERRATSAMAILFSTSSKISTQTSTLLPSTSSKISTWSSTPVPSSSSKRTSTPLSSTSALPVDPITVTNLAGYAYLGCYSEATSPNRALSGLLNPIPAGSVSVEACAAACFQYTYFGVKYASQCYCGNTIGTGSVLQASTVPSVNGCNMLCKNNTLQYCGGGNRLNMYQGFPITVTSLAGYTYLGCYSEPTSGRALADLLNPIPAASVTVEACAAACSQYNYFGVEYASQCYCGNIINAASINQTSSNPSFNGCNMVCKNNALEYCGGGNRLNVYKVVPVVKTSSSSSAIRSSSFKTSSSSRSSVGSSKVSSSSLTLLSSSSGSLTGKSTSTVSSGVSSSGQTLLSSSSSSIPGRPTSNMSSGVSSGHILLPTSNLSEASLTGRPTTPIISGMSFSGPTLPPPPKSFNASLTAKPTTAMSSAVSSLGPMALPTTKSAKSTKVVSSGVSSSRPTLLPTTYSSDASPTAKTGTPVSSGVSFAGTLLPTINSSNFSLLARHANATNVGGSSGPSNLSLTARTEATYVRESSTTATMLTQSSVVSPNATMSGPSSSKPALLLTLSPVPTSNGASAVSMGPSGLSFANLNTTAKITASTVLPITSKTQQSSRISVISPILAPSTSNLRKTSSSVSSFTTAKIPMPTLFSMLVWESLFNSSNTLLPSSSFSTSSLSQNVILTTKQPRRTSNSLLVLPPGLSNPQIFSFRASFVAPINTSKPTTPFAPKTSSMALPSNSSSRVFVGSSGSSFSNLVSTIAQPNGTSKTTSLVLSPSLSLPKTSSSLFFVGLSTKSIQTISFASVATNLVLSINPLPPFTTVFTASFSSPIVMPITSFVPATSNLVLSFTSSRLFVTSSPLTTPPTTKKSGTSGTSPISSILSPSSSNLTKTSSIVSSMNIASTAKLLSMTLWELPSISLTTSPSSLSPSSPLSSQVVSAKSTQTSGTSLVLSSNTSNLPRASPSSSSVSTQITQSTIATYLPSSSSSSAQARQSTVVTYLSSGSSSFFAQVTQFTITTLSSLSNIPSNLSSFSSKSTRSTRGSTLSMILWEPLSNSISSSTQSTTFSTPTTLSTMATYLSMVIWEPMMSSANHIPMVTLGVVAPTSSSILGPVGGLAVALNTTMLNAIITTILVMPMS